MFPLFYSSRAIRIYITHAHTFSYFLSYFLFERKKLLNYVYSVFIIATTYNLFFTYFSPQYFVGGCRFYQTLLFCVFVENCSEQKMRKYDKHTRSGWGSYFVVLYTHSGRWNRVCIKGLLAGLLAGWLAGCLACSLLLICWPTRRSLKLKQFWARIFISIVFKRSSRTIVEIKHNEFETEHWMGIQSIDSS